MYTISKEKVKYNKQGDVIIPEDICDTIIACAQYKQAEKDLDRYIAAHYDADNNFVQDDPLIDRKYIDHVCGSPYLIEAMVETYHDLKNPDNYKKLYDQVFRMYYDKRFKDIYQSWYYECGDPDYKGD